MAQIENEEKSIQVAVAVAASLPPNTQTKGNRKSQR
jgi:hypothetical protein